MKVLMLAISDDTSSGIEAVDVHLHSHVDSAWNDLLDQIEYAGGDEKDIDGSKESLKKGEQVCYFGDSYSMFLSWKEVQS